VISCDSSSSDTFCPPGTFSSSSDDSKGFSVISCDSSSSELDSVTLIQIYVIVCFPDVVC